MTNDDLSQIGKLLDGKLTVTEKRLKADIGGTEKRLRTELNTTLDAKLAGTEKRLRREMGSLKAEIVASEKRIITEIVDFVHDQLMPLIDDKAEKTDIDNVTRRTDYLGDKVGEHDIRLKNIESIPVIAHQLKVKKAK